MACIALLPLRVKRWGSFILIGFTLSISCHHPPSITLFSLNTLYACWIAVNRWNNSSTCMQESVYLLTNMMPICNGNCHQKILHNYSLSYQLPNTNLFTHSMFSTREKPLAKTMAPRVYSFTFLFIFYLYLSNYPSTLLIACK